MAAMDGVDAIVFTAGIGEHVDRVRAAALADMDYFGIKIDPEKNLNCPSGQIAEIQADDSRVKVLVIPTNEELAIARETMVVANLA
jgi:acetate kinase